MQFTPMNLGELYFYTATILNWQKLLAPNHFKDIIIDSLQYLVGKGKIKVYAFVIMPNHIHIIWEMLAMNGKEMPNASFFKYTAHHFLHTLKEKHPQILPYFYVGSTTRQYQFWERNSLPILLFTPKVFIQKLDYLHNNPLQEHWNLAGSPDEYAYSSAKFYKDGKDNFDILTHYRDRI